MAETGELRSPWLVAVWPGMGSVSLLAGSYLLQQLGAQRAIELDTHEYFEIQSVEVHNGVATAGRPPRSLFLEWRDPRGRRDLLFFIGEAQPASGGYGLCQTLLDHAIRRGVSQVVTFAAMATQLHPGNEPRAFVAATDAASLSAAKELNAEVLESGQISGLNGVLLAAAAERGLHGTCLLGELPYFAVGVPNPSAAHAVLSRFVELAGIEVDLADLQQQAQLVEQQLLQLMEQMQQENPEVEGAESAIAESAAAVAPEEVKPVKPEPPKLDARQRRRIETLFEQARRDRSRAMELKNELDRMGAFKEYEDRFLDLFRKAE